MRGKGIGYMRKLCERMPWLILATMIPAFVGALFLSACAPQSEPAPSRTFKTEELLIGLSEMPTGWKVSYGPTRTEDYISGRDASGIVFVAGTDLQPGRRDAAHRVYHYDNATKAKGVYEDLVLPGEVGKSPSEWTYRSPIVDQSRVVCYDYEGREPYPVCTWSGRYEEYIVIFRSWLIPGYMSLHDMERVVKAIDARMAQHLGKS